MKIISLLLSLLFFLFDIVNCKERIVFEENLFNKYDIVVYGEIVSKKVIVIEKDKMTVYQPVACIKILESFKGDIPKEKELMINWINGTLDRNSAEMYNNELILNTHVL